MRNVVGLKTISILKEVRICVAVPSAHLLCILTVTSARVIGIIGVRMLDFVGDVQKPGDVKGGM